MVAVLKSIHTLFPWASSRHWFFWADCFSAAICLATVCLVSPQNPLVDLCLSDVTDVVAMYQAIRDAYPGGALRENLQCLQYLLQRIHGRISQTDPYRPFLSNIIPTSDEQSAGGVGGDDPMDLVGWKTRLVQVSEVRAVSNGNQRRASLNGAAGGSDGRSLEDAQSQAAAGEGTVGLSTYLQDSPGLVSLLGVAAPHAEHDMTSLLVSLVAPQVSIVDMSSCNNSWRRHWVKVPIKRTMWRPQLTPTSRPRPRAILLETSAHMMASIIIRTLDGSPEYKLSITE